MPSQQTINQLQAVKKHILEEPNRLVMSHWLINDKPPGFIVTDTYTDVYVQQETPSCGTTGCIRGWLQTLFPNVYYEDLLSDICTSLLYYVDNWEDSFRERYYKATSAKEKAQVCADYIDYICENGTIDIKY